MILTDLSPRWYEIGGNPRAGFVFRCPACRNIWLSCKAIVVSTRDQLKIFHELGLNEDVEGGTDVVPMRPEVCWKIEGDFTTMRVHPSIHAGAAGHWHGWIGQQGVQPGGVSIDASARCQIKEVRE
jgi:hypothetical protein